MKLQPDIVNVQLVNSPNVLTMSFYNIYARDPEGMSFENIIFIFNEPAIAGSLSTCR